MTALAALLVAISPPSAAGQQGVPADPNDALGFGPESTESTAGSTTAGSEEDALGFAPSGVASTPSVPELSVSSDEPSRFTLSATLRLQGAVRTETDQPQRLAKLRQVLDASFEYKPPLGRLHTRLVVGVHTEADFAYLGNLTAFDSVTMETLGWQVWPGTTFLSLGLAPIALTTGYQIINFGEGEMISLLDLVNGRDLREGPLMTDLSNMRLPSLATSVTLGVGPVRFEGVVVHEAAFGLLPPILGEFSPVRGLLLANSAVDDAFQGRVLRNLHLPRRDIREIEASQLFARMTWIESGVDVKLLVGSTLQRLGLPSLPDAAELTGPVLDFPLSHPRYGLFANSGTITAGPFMLRWELLFNYAYPIALQRTDTSLTDWSGARRHALAGLLGVTYLASTTTSAAFEVNQTYIFDNPERRPELHLKPLFPLEATQLAFRFNHSFLRERASLALAAMLFGLAPFNAWAARIEIGYALLDNLDVSAGYLTYQPSSNFGFFYGFTQHDRVFINVRFGMGQ